MRVTMSVMLLLIAVLAAGLADAAPGLDDIVRPRRDRLDPNPYPGGSPFPPGGEPSLTHVVKAYWTTVDNMVTRIDVTAKGSRPIQLDVQGGGATIGPECDVHLRLAATKQEREDGVWDQTVKGRGMMTLRVYGFKIEDYSAAPAARVRYFKDGKLVGETSVTVQPVSEKIKRQAAEKRK